MTYLPNYRKSEFVFSTYFNKSLFSKGPNYKKDEFELAELYNLNVLNSFHKTERFKDQIQIDFILKPNDSKAERKKVEFWPTLETPVHQL